MNTPAFLEPSQPMLCQCGRGIVACGGVCLRCWNDIQAKVGIWKWKPLDITSTERRTEPLIPVAPIHFSSTDAAESTLTAESLAEMLSRLPPPPRKIIRSEFCVDAEGRPAAYELNGRLIVHPDFTAANGRPLPSVGF